MLAGNAKTPKASKDMMSDSSRDYRLAMAQSDVKAKKCIKKEKVHEGYFDELFNKWLS